MTSSLGKQAIVKILKEHGHDIFIGTRNKKFRCTCYNETNGEGSCEKCFGTGYVVILKRVSAYRKRNAQLPMPDTRKEGVVGSENRQGFMYVVGPDVEVTKGDVLLELPLNGYEKHKVRTTYNVYDGKDCVFKEIFTIGEGD